jgi:hypothetical protein
LAVSVAAAPCEQIPARSRVLAVRIQAEDLPWTQVYHLDHQYLKHRRFTTFMGSIALEIVSGRKREALCPPLAGHGREL